MGADARVVYARDGDWDRRRKWMGLSESAGERVALTIALETKESGGEHGIVWSFG